GIMSEGLHERIYLHGLDVPEVRVLLAVGPIEPRKRLVQLRAITVSQGNVLCTVVRVITNKPRESRIGFSPASQRVINSSQTEVALLTGFLLHLCQRGVELPLREQYESERAVAAVIRRADLEYLARLGLRLVQPSS